MPVVPLVVLGVLALLLAGAYVASQSVYFVGTNSRGFVTVFRGLPYELPGHARLYSTNFVTGVSASTLSADAAPDAARPLAALPATMPPTWCAGSSSARSA